MIDIHCHILPGIDDGPKTMEQSLAIARSLAAQGYRHVIATPHAMDGIYNADPVNVYAKTTEVNQVLRHAEINLTVYPGAEYPLGPELLDMDLVTLNKSRYLLVELPFNQPIPPYTTDIFFQLQARGLVPILAHPERCGGILESPLLVREYAELGVLMQANVASFYGRYGSRAKKLVDTWAVRNLIHFLATDCHRPLKYNLAQLKQFYDDSWLDRLSSINPRSVINDYEFRPGPPAESKPKTPFSEALGALFTRRFR